jgi:cobalt-precorrin 5A hydrolase
VTPRGADLARRIAASFPNAEIYLSSTLTVRKASEHCFGRLFEKLSAVFHHYRGHVFVMAAGIVIRAIAPLIQQKTMDPAVVAADETGRYAVSLLSGHIGGANVLTRRVAEAIGADPVITTATDVNRLPAVDVLATDLGLVIENPEAIKSVHMAILGGEKITCHDPFGLIGHHFTTWVMPDSGHPDVKANSGADRPGIYVSDVRTTLPANILVLRPKSLVAGIGCNRDTPMDEIKACLDQTLERFQCAPHSLGTLATIRIKADEDGLLALAEDLKLPLVFFDQRELETARGVCTPSETVEKYVGVKSVCEAAAILAAGQGELIVPKQKTQNVTVAIARRSSMS